jgi:coenzyme Q-binding protein COQ10
MPVHNETKFLPYTPEQVFNLVADVERYPEFLPWCVACRIVSRQSPDRFTADLIVGFKMVREQFTSLVELSRPNSIRVTYLKGPFQRLTNIWDFRAVPGGTEVKFHLEFEFRSRMLQMLIGVLFEEAVRRMVAAFEDRARQLYSSPSPSA